MIHTLSVDNYRSFKHFQLANVSRVNLIVGDNNSAKTSLLEAIHLLNNDRPVGPIIIQILRDRGEFSRAIDNRVERITSGYQISNLFNKRNINKTINISSDNKSISLYPKKNDRDNIAQMLLLDDEDIKEIVYKEIVIEHIHKKNMEQELLQINQEGQIISSRLYHRPSMKNKSKLVFINSLEYEDLSLLWDDITLTPREDKVIQALRILEPNVDRISFVSRQSANSGILVKLSSESEPIPLGSMGDGMRRILAIASSLVSVENGTLLVDEIDTGLYYAALSGMWDLVFETAERLNIQVFATTHSWDCVRSFQKSLSKLGKPAFGSLIRLDRIKDNIRPTIFSLEDLDIAIRKEIEVR